MEKINFKPQLKKEKFLFFVTFLLATIIGLLVAFVSSNIISGILVMFVICLVGFIINIIFYFIKKSYDYEINTENEIIINYKFINKNSSTIRLDQLTSVSLNQSFLEKILNLYTIRFGIFGKTNYLGGTGRIPQNQAGFDNQEFLTLDKNLANDIFSHLLEEMSADSNEKIMHEKPKIFASLFWGFFFMFIFSLGLIIIPIILNGINIDLIGKSLYFIISFIFIFIIFLLQIFIHFLKVKSTNYEIYTNSVELSYNYILGSYNTRIPFKKITNSEFRKNLISHALFGIGHSKVFTGGSNDPVFNTFKNYELFSNKISSLYSKSTGFDGNLENRPVISAKPGSSYFSTFFFYVTMFFALILIFLFEFISIFIVPLTIIYFILLILRYILYKNTFYDFYQDKIIDRSGIINIKNKEISIEKIKYVSLVRPLFFDRISNQGTIHLYTPGTDFVDNKLNSIDDYDKIYNGLRDLLEER